MRPVAFPAKPGPNAPIERKVEWLMSMMEVVAAFSQEDSGSYTDPFTITNATPLRTLNSATATLAQTAQVLATLIQDFKRRGMNRGAG